MPLSEREKQVLNDLMRWDAPAAMGNLPSVWRENPAAPFLDFLRAWRFEAQDILEHGDSLVASGDIDYSEEDNLNYLQALFGLGRMAERHIPPSAAEIMAIKTLIPALGRLCRFYDVKIQRCHEELVRVGRNIEIRKRQEARWRAEGDTGYQKIYDVIKPDMNDMKQPDGKYDFSHAARSYNDYHEEKSLYRNAQRIHPALFGPSPQMRRYIDALDLLSGDIERNRRVVKDGREAVAKIADAYASLGWYGHDVMLHQKDDQLLLSVEPA